MVGVVVAAANVDGADQGYPRERNEDGYEFADAEFLDAEEGAEEQCEDARGAGEDRARGDSRVFETS